MQSSLFILKLKVNLKMMLRLHQVCKNNFETFFPHIILINMYQILKSAKPTFVLEKPGITPNFGFLPAFFWALFDTFITRCIHSGIKFEFSF